ncbi:hypothetical protein [Geodermatophilus sp. SYSU D01176]
MAREQRLHVEQVRAHRFTAGWGPKRSATTVPAPLRYWQYRPPRPLAVAFTAALVGAWLGVFGWGGGWPAVRDELPLVLAAGAVVLLLNTSRTTVSDHGLSFDVAGARTDPSRVVPLVQVREVRRGRPPEGWPAAERRGGWWPGRTRVAVRHGSGDGAGEQALTTWVRDPEAFADALGRPLG